MSSCVCNFIDLNINMLFDIDQLCALPSAIQMSGRQSLRTRCVNCIIPFVRNHAGDVWFDTECRATKRLTRRLERVFSAADGRASAAQMSDRAAEIGHGGGYYSGLVSAATWLTSTPWLEMRRLLRLEVRGWLSGSQEPMPVKKQTARLQSPTIRIHQLYHRVQPVLRWPCWSSSSADP
jgi:hypothetical protein